MGIFNSMFGGDKEDKTQENNSIPWTQLTTVEQLEEIKEKSLAKPQFLYKHSTTCGISKMVLNQLEKNPQLLNDSFDLYFLDLKRYREVSNAIATKFEVEHQSPQVLILKNGSTVAHTSHGDINDLVLEKYA